MVRSSLILIAYILMASSIAQSKKVLELHNIDNDPSLFKENKYHIKRADKKAQKRDLTKKQVLSLIKKMKAQKVTKDLDLLDKQIFVHRFLQYPKEKIKLFYPKLSAKQIIEFKARLK